jgi:hypothetical protein
MKTYPAKIKEILDTLSDNTEYEAFSSLPESDRPLTPPMTAYDAVWSGLTDDERSLTLSLVDDGGVDFLVIHDGTVFLISFDEIEWHVEEIGKPEIFLDMPDEDISNLARWLPGVEIKKGTEVTPFYDRFNERFHEIIED